MRHPIDQSRSGPRQWLPALLAVAILGSVMRPATARTPAERLADRFMADAVLLAESEPITREALEAALLLLEEAVSLNPDDEGLWRTFFDLAVVLEREDLQAQAVSRICELDPTDEVARWRRLDMALARHQTVDERIAAYGTLLDPASRASIGDAVASRLALDLALLHRRRGDERSFAEWLARSVSLDRGHRAAAAMAVDYFHSRVKDDYGRAELLLNLMVCDPSDLSTRLALGRLLLEQGAYQGAERLLSVIISPVVAGSTLDQALVADVAIAQWGLGRDRVALDTIRRAQGQADAAFREHMRQERPELSALDLAHQSATLAPVLATVRAAIQFREGDPDAGSSLAHVVASYDEAIAAASAATPPQPQATAQLHLELAMVLAWLGGDLDRVRQELSAAESMVGLSDQARQRFDGWIAFREGRLDAAGDVFSALAATDPPAQLGLALVLLEQGRRSDGARELLTLARAQPGTLLGVWAADRLFEVVKQHTAIHTGVKRFDDLVASVPPTFDRALEDPSTFVTVEVTPVNVTSAPYDPILVDIEVTNSSIYPIAIDPQGPLRPQVLLEISARIAQVTRVGDLKPVVVDIARRLTLKPRERLVVRVDLRRQRVGQLLNELPLLGALIRVKATTNFVISPAGAFLPGPLGSQAICRPFRVDGVRFTQPWVERTMAEMLQAARPGNLADMAMLSHLAAAGVAAQLAPEEQRLFTDAVTALSETFTRLDPASQAWMLGSLRRGTATADILAIARRSEERLVKFAYLIYCVEGEQDPMIDAARRDADVRVREMAEIAAELFRRRQASAAPR